MTALIKDRNTTRKATGQVDVLLLAAGAKIYAGSQVCINSDGYAVPAADTAGLKFAGVSRGYADNTGGANGAVSVDVWRDGVFDFVGSALTLADVGKPAFIVDDQTIGLSSTNAVGCGVISEVESATKAWVDITPANRRTGQAQASVTAAAPGSITAADASAAAAATPTKEEFDAVVTLVNQNKAATNELRTLANESKTVINGLLTKLKAAGIIGS